ATRMETLEQVRSQEPISPSRLQPEVPRGLEAICLKCLEKLPAQRYASAAALADDLGRWLEGKQPAVRPPYWPMRLWRKTRPHRRISLTVLLVGLIAVTWLFTREDPDPDRPLREIENRLTKGEAVELIGEAGGSQWSRWSVGEGVVAKAKDPGQPFVFKAPP